MICLLSFLFNYVRDSAPIKSRVSLKAFDWKLNGIGPTFKSAGFISLSDKIDVRLEVDARCYRVARHVKSRQLSMNDETHRLNPILERSLREVLFA